MGKQKDRTQALRRQKAKAGAAKARKEKNRQVRIVQEARERGRKEARRNWPSESEFSAEEHLFWIQHGVNFLVSDSDEGVWKPLFPMIYEGTSLTPEGIAQALLGSTGETTEALAWTAQPRQIIYMFRQRCVARLRETLAESVSRDVLLERVKQPHEPSVWSVFDELRGALKERRKARSEVPVDALLAESVAGDGLS